MNTIPTGYKQTEIGVIPEDWDYLPFGELVYEFRGGAPLAPKDFTSIGMPVLPKSGVTRGGYLRISEKNQQYCTQNFAGKNKSSFVDKTFSIIVLRDLVPSGPNIGLIVAIRDDNEYILAQGVYGFKVLEEKTDPSFLIHLSNSNEYRRLMKSILVGSTQVHIRNTTLKQTKIPLPTKSEQQLIATALSDTDLLIESLEKLIAKKRQIKQGAMQELLTGKKRLAGFSGEWENVTAGEIGRFRGGCGFPIKYQGLSEGNYPFYKVSDMNNEGNTTFMNDSNNWISEKIRKSLGATVFPANSIVFAKVGAAIFLERKKILLHSSCIDNNMTAYTLDNSRSDYRFIHYLLLNTKLGSLVATSALPSLNGKQLAEISFTLPPLEEQTAIAKILSDMDAEITALEERLEKTRILKSGMMHELLTGRIRLI